MDANKIIRRVQLTGGSTFIVSIPKEWAEKMNIDKGSLVVLSLESDGSIRLVPSSRRPEPLAAAEIRVRKGMSHGSVLREIMSMYLTGYKTIRVVFSSEDLEFRKALKDVITRKLIGVEILHEDSREMVLQILVNVEDLPVSSILTKMLDVSLSMLADIKAALESDGKILLSDVSSRDDIIDKLYLYGLRQLHTGLRGVISLEEIGLQKVDEVLHYAMVLKSLERIGDHTTAIALTLGELRDRGRVGKELIALTDRISQFIKSALNAFMTRDKDSANRLLDVDAVELKNFENDVFRKLSLEVPEEVSTVRTIIGSYRRILEYGTDILETTIDLQSEHSSAPHNLALSRTRAQH
jgi:AbrB family looped-hinge helix DNA binding protein